MHQQTYPASRKISALRVSLFCKYGKLYRQTTIVHAADCGFPKEIGTKKPFGNNPVPESPLSNVVSVKTPWIPQFAATNCEFFRISSTKLTFFTLFLYFICLIQNFLLSLQPQRCNCLCDELSADSSVATPQRSYIILTNQSCLVEV